MTVHLYLSLIPEALVASMLSPEEFGSYYAVSHNMKVRGQALFLEVDPDFRHEFFPIEEAYAKCVPHEDGAPKASVYISGYRVLEHMDVKALQKLYLVSSYGMVLGLDAGEFVPEKSDELHLYQEIAPVSRMVVSNLPPRTFYESITIKPTKFIKFPAMAFVDLELGELATDPERGRIGNLPYRNIEHLRDCLMSLKPDTKATKMVDRLQSAEFPYRMVRKGFHIGVGPDLMFYPMPSQEDLRDKYYRWWRSATR